MISVNPCLIVEVPWTYKKAKEEIALTQEEQNEFLNEVEDSWYKEMFYFMFSDRSACWRTGRPSVAGYKLYKKDYGN